MRMQCGIIVEYKKLNKFRQKSEKIEIEMGPYPIDIISVLWLTAKGINGCRLCGGMPILRLRGDGGCTVRTVTVCLPSRSMYSMNARCNYRAIMCAHHGGSPVNTWPQCAMSILIHTGAGIIVIKGII